MGLILVADDEASSRQTPKEAKMGLADILTGMMNGPRGQRQPSSGGGGGMSPIMMALLGLLAYKALKGRGGQAAHPGGTDQRMPPGGTASAGTAGGGLGDILGGLFGGKPGAAHRDNRRLPEPHFQVIKIDATGRDKGRRKGSKRCGEHPQRPGSSDALSRKELALCHAERQRPLQIRRCCHTR